MPRIMITELICSKILLFNKNNKIKKILFYFGLVYFGLKEDLSVSDKFFAQLVTTSPKFFSIQLLIAVHLRG